MIRFVLISPEVLSLTSKPVSVAFVLIQIATSVLLVVILRTLLSRASSQSLQHVWYLYPCLFLVSHNKIIRTQHIPWHVSSYMFYKASIAMINSRGLR